MKSERGRNGRTTMMVTVKEIFEEGFDDNYIDENEGDSGGEEDE